MAKAEHKTKATELSVAAYIAAQAEPRRSEVAAINALLRKVTGVEAAMWGPSIIGYGSYTYKYESGREGTMCQLGFSPRKAALTFYATSGAAASDEGTAVMARLGKYTTGKGYLYIKQLADVDQAALADLLALSWQSMNVRFPD